MISQMTLMLSIFAILACGFYLVLTVLVMNKVYQPSMYNQFKKQIETSFNERTTLMTAAIGLRIDGFEGLIKNLT